MVLAACTDQSGMTPSAPPEAAPATAQAPITSQNDTSADSAANTPDAASQDSALHDTTDTSVRVLRTCATSPPQYLWIFKGACRRFDLNPTGAHFSFGEYQNLTVKGTIGKNTAKAPVKIALADAIDKSGDIETYKGKAFPPYRAKGITYVYAAAINQGSQIIKPITVQGKPVFQATITDANGFGNANRCGMAVLTLRAGKPKWIAVPATGIPHGKTVTISDYVAPAGFVWSPKLPVYFAVNCYKSLAAG